MTIKQELAFISKENKSNGMLLQRSVEDILLKLAPYEKSFKSLCPIMGLKRYCELSNIQFKACPNIPYDYARINFEGKKLFIVLKPLGLGKKPILLDIGINSFLHILNTAKSCTFKYYHRSITLRHYIGQENRIDITVQSKKQYGSWAEVEVSPSFLEIKDVAELKQQFLKEVRGMGKRNTLYKAVKPRKIKAQTL